MRFSSPFLSTPAGQLATRVGPRLFGIIGPLLMAAGLLWLARIPADSEPWLADIADPSTLIPRCARGRPAGAAAVRARHRHGGRAADDRAHGLRAGAQRRPRVNPINNAVSRVGSPLVSALLFVAIGDLLARLAGLAPKVVDDPAVREQVQPLTSIPDDTDPELADAARQASTDAFHLAMLVAAALLGLGSAISAIGIRNPARGAPEPAPEAAASTG